MKKKEKIFIGILVVVAIIIIVALAVIRNKKNTNDGDLIGDNGETEQIGSINNGENENIQNEDVQSEEKIGTSDIEEPENEVVEEKYVQVLEDQTKLNTSSKLLENKEIDGISLTDIQLTEKDNVSLLLGNLTNNTQEKKGGYAANVRVADENDNELITMYVYIPELDPGESTQLSTNATMDFANAYNFTITKAE